MNQGRAKNRITFKTPSEGKDSDGFPIVDPVHYVTVFAELNTLKGRSFYAAAAEQKEFNREFSIRYQKKLDEKNRPENLIMFWNGLQHDFILENDDGLNVTMTVFAKAVR